MWRPTLAAAALLAAGCFPTPVDLAGKVCDAEGACSDGYTCFEGRCLTDAELAEIAARECKVGETLPCGSQVGACRPGVRSCQADYAFGPCEGAVDPVLERCDGVDNDCDGSTDESYDNDRDGYGPEGVTGCPKSGVDCDDADPQIFPGAAERCNGADDNCNGTSDEGLDQDLDGYGRWGAEGCRNPGVDCDDANPNAYPGATEQCNGFDDDCDSVTDEGLDEDLDGFGVTGSEGCLGIGADCDDKRASAFPGAPELCNGLDDDCDTDVDEGIDGDHDGYGVAGATGCPNPGVDCDDADPFRNPGEVESCNGLDDDCDSVTDEGLDEDQDGYGVLGATGCRNPGVDCDDKSASIFPGRTETCNALDDDCSGKADDPFACVAGSQLGTCSYAGTACTVDGLQSCSLTCQLACEPPAEICNGADDDCDGTTDGLFGVPAVKMNLVSGSTRPHLAGLPGGGFLAVWEEPPSAGATVHGVRLGLFSGTGALLSRSAPSADLATNPLPAVSDRMAVWLEPQGNSTRVRALPLTPGAGSVALGSAVWASPASVGISGTGPLRLGEVNDAPAVLWRVAATNMLTLQRLNASGTANGSPIDVDASGNAPAFALDESGTNRRTLVAYLKSGQVATRRVSMSGMALEAEVYFGTGVASLAAAGGAIARVERDGTNDTLVLRRLDSGKAEVTVTTLPASSIPVIALGRVGDSQTWLVSWIQPQAAGGLEVVARRATSTPGGWQLGPTTTVSGWVTSGPVSAGDDALPAVAYSRGTDLYLRVLCP